MGKCIRMECYYCKTIRNFYVNVNNYKCTVCYRIIPHAPIDERYTTGYGYKSQRPQFEWEEIKKIDRK